MTSSGANRLTIDYRLTGAGWAACTIRFNQVACEITASYLSDALAKLVLGALSVVADLHSVSIGFDEEPGEYRWAIVRTGDGTCRVTILSFPDWLPAHPDSSGEPLMIFECSSVEFGRAVRDAASRVLAEYGSEGYVEKWDVPFPARELALLEAWLAARDRTPSDHVH
jgi:hypothetical protein